jgi:hypothetical protein
VYTFTTAKPVVVKASIQEIQSTIKEPPVRQTTFIDNLDSQSATVGPLSIESDALPKIFESFTLNYERLAGFFGSNKKSENGKERFFGPTSLESVVRETTELVVKPFIESDLSNRAVKQLVTTANTKINELIAEVEDFTEDGLPLEAPPLPLLEAMIEPYFALVNPRFPIWTKDKFTKLTTVVQASEDRCQNRAYVVCANNLILMTLTSNSLRYCQRKDSKSDKLSSIDADIIRTFLANAKRAIRNVQLLVAPSLLNVQALLSLVSSLVNLYSFTD